MEHGHLNLKFKYKRRHKSINVLYVHRHMAEVTGQNGFKCLSCVGSGYGTVSCPILHKVTGAAAESGVCM